MALFVNVLSKTKTFTVYDDASNTSNEYKIGDIILNFVNTDTKKYFNKDKLLQKYDNSVVSRLFSKWDDYHAIFDCAIHYCFEKDIKSLNKLTTAQRYLLFSFFIYPNLSEMLELNIKVHSRCIPIGENIDVRLFLYRIFYT